MLSTKNKKIMNKFAMYFDKIYSDKNYKKECDFIQKILSKNKMKRKEMLDLGCGTGTHALILAKNGFKITGVDISKTAIELAKKKFKKNKIDAKFLKGDMTTINLKKKFDICISMFSSLCYLTDIPNFTKALKNIHNHLKKDGILIFDFWNGNVVVNEKPSIKIKKILNNNEKIIRTATPELNIKNQTCSIKYHCIIKKKSKVLDEFTETHTMRYHFIDDLQQYMRNVGFKKINVLPMISNKNISDNEKFLKNWYLFCIAKKS